MNSGSTARARHVRAHDAGMSPLCNLPLLWKLPSAWHDRRDLALDGERDTDLWLWLFAAALSVGGRPALLRSLLHAARPAARAPRRRRAVRGSGRRAVTAHDRRSRRCRRRRSRPPATSCTRSAPSRTYESVAATSPPPPTPTTRSYVWGSEPEIYWASDRLPGHALPHHADVPHRQLSRAARPTTPTPAPTPRPPGRTSTRTSRAAPAEVLRSTRHRRRCAARSTTRSRASPGSSTSSTRSTVRRHHRRHRHLQAQVAS